MFNIRQAANPLLSGRSNSGFWSLRERDQSSCSQKRRETEKSGNIFIKMFTRTWLKRPRDSCLSLWFTDADVEPRVDPAAVLLRPGCTQLPCASSNLVTRSELLTTLVTHPAVRTDRLSKATGQSRTPIEDHHHYYLNHHQLLEMWPNVCSGEPGQSLS